MGWVDLTVDKGHRCTLPPVYENHSPQLNKIWECDTCQRWWELLYFKDNNVYRWVQLSVIEKWSLKRYLSKNRKK